MLRQIVGKSRSWRSLMLHFAIARWLVTLGEEKASGFYLAADWTKNGGLCICNQHLEFDSFLTFRVEFVHFRGRPRNHFLKVLEMLGELRRFEVGQRLRVSEQLLECRLHRLVLVQLGHRGDETVECEHQSLGAAGLHRL